MEIKDKIKKEIDEMPEELLYQVQKYLETIRKAETRKRGYRTLHLKGRYDDVGIRQKAYG